MKPLINWCKIILLNGLWHDVVYQPLLIKVLWMKEQYKFQMRVNCETKPLHTWQEFWEWSFGHRFWNFKLYYQTYEYSFRQRYVSSHRLWGFACKYIKFWEGAFRKVATTIPHLINPILPAFNSSATYALKFRESCLLCFCFNYNVDQIINSGAKPVNALRLLRTE
jgi:hypothetical protein